MMAPAKFYTTLHLDRRLPLGRRIGAHALFAWVQGAGQPIKLDQAERDRIAADPRMKPLKSWMIDQAIVDLIAAGVIDRRIEGGANVISIARNAVQLLLEGGVA